MAVLDFPRLSQTVAAAFVPYCVCVLVSCVYFRLRGDCFHVYGAERPSSNNRDHDVATLLLCCCADPYDIIHGGVAAEYLVTRTAAAAIAYVSTLPVARTTY